MSHSTTSPGADDSAGRIAASDGLTAEGRAAAGLQSAPPAAPESRPPAGPHDGRSAEPDGHPPAASLDGPPAGLTLVVGPANSGKLGRVLHWWDERQPFQPLIVVPTGPDARSLSIEMAQRRGALIGQSPAVTFDGLVRELLGRSPDYAGEFERSLLVGHLLHEEPPEAPGFSARFPGTAGVTAALLEQLGDSGRSPEEIEGVLRRWAAADPASAALAADIERLHAGYLVLRDRLGLSDRSEAVREAATLAGRWRRPLALYGFTSFTLAQRRLVVQLAETVEVLLVFDYELSRERSLTSRAEFGHWVAQAVRVEELSPAQLAYTSPAISFLERHFLDDGPLDDRPPAWADGMGVRFLLASGRRNEAELAAEQVAALIRSGVAPGDIAVVVRSIEPWGRLLDDVFWSCGIPCQVDERLKLDASGLGYAFIAALRGSAGDRPESVLAYLRGPYSSLDPERAADIELDYLRGTARGLAALTRHAERVAPGCLDSLHAALERNADGFSVDPTGAQALARGMLACSLAAATGHHQDVAADARAHQQIQGAFARLARLSEAGSLPAKMLRVDVLLPALAGVTVPAGPTGSTHAVQVLTAHRARARRFQAVLLLGLVEGEFPGRPQRPSLLTTAQRAQLDRLAGGMFSPDTDMEEALFVRAVSRAWRVLMLSSRDADDGGGHAGQSYYWTHCRELLEAAAAPQPHRTLAHQAYEPDVAPSLSHYLRACSAAGLHPHPSSGCAGAPPAAWTRPGPLACLGSQAVLDELAAAACFSPSVLETYLRCPFAWFIDRVVGTEDMETLADARLVGEWLHAVLRDTFRELAAEGRLPIRPENLQYAVQTARTIVERTVEGEACPGSPADRRLVSSRLMRMASDLLSMEADSGAGLVTVDTEVAVGGERGVDVGGLAIRGRIDRVDGTPEGRLFIVDYKSGSTPGKNKIGTAEGLQLPLYMLALAAERPGVTVTGGAYVSPGSKEVAGVVASGCEHLLGENSRGCRIAGGDEFEQMLQGALELAKQAAEGMRSGAIAPLPERDCPPWCALGPVCRARRGRQHS